MKKVSRRQSKCIVTASGLKLTPKQEAFCRAYTDFGNQETFGNATNAYKYAYQNTASWSTQEAAKMKTNETIMKRINELLQRQGLNDVDVDLEHLKVIKQDRDLSNKMKGIIEFNRLKGRGVQSGNIINVNVISFTNADQRNSPVPVRPDEEAVSVRDIGEPSEE